MRFRRVLIPFALGWPVALPAQATDSLSLTGQRILAVGLGIGGASEAVAGAGQTDARSTGTLASLTYAHFVGPAVAIEIGATVLDANASVSTTSGTSASAVTALLIGLDHAPQLLAITPAIRPFVSGAVGAYFHSASRASGGGGAYASMQSRVGGRAGAGSNFFVARHMVVRVEGQYHLVQRFDAVNASTPDPSGLSFTLGLGFAWGR